MPPLSRRLLLQVLAGAVPTLGAACSRRSPDERDRVCVHVYPPTLELPPPLLQPGLPAPGARPQGLLDSGLPEFFLCSSTVGFRELFPYYWPPLESEFRRLAASMQVVFSVATITGAAEVASIEQRLSGESAPPGTRLVAALTYNDFTRAFSARILTAARAAHVDETVIIKDPSVPPYLCDFPGAQKKFRRQP